MIFCGTYSHIHHDFVIFSISFALLNASARSSSSSFTKSLTSSSPPLTPMVSQGRVGAGGLPEKVVTGAGRAFTFGQSVEGSSPTALNALLWNRIPVSSLKHSRIIHRSGMRARLLRISFLTAPPPTSVQRRLMACVLSLRRYATRHLRSHTHRNDSRRTILLRRQYNAALVSPSQTAIYVKCHTVHDIWSLFFTTPPKPCQKVVM